MPAALHAGHFTWAARRPHSAVVEAAIVRNTPHNHRRRVNAPIMGAGRSASTIPDLLFAVSATVWAMATVFLAATLFGGRFVDDSAARTLARVFAGSLALSGVFIFFLGVVLLRGDRHDLDHYATPMIVGVATGVIEAWMFLDVGGSWLLAPPLLLLFALRPVRRLLSGLLPANGGRR